MTNSITKRLFIILAMFSISFAYGQKEVYFQLNQYLGNTPFALGGKGTNDLGTTFSISRLDYYISSIKLHHDGKTTSMPDKYIFVSQGQKVNELLGNFDISRLDSITFAIGVDSIDNHADPTLWPAGHPLAPKSPEMHWGWASGFRFVAVEGKSGANLEFNYEIHGLGDELYKPTTIVTNGAAQNVSITVSIDADYTKSFKSININKNLNFHGNKKEAIPLINNYNKHVFTSAGISEIDDITLGNLNIYPNPTIQDNVTIALNEVQIINSQLIVRDALGRFISKITHPTAGNSISLNQTGFYLVELVQDGRVTHRSSVIRQ
jgi:hypothetical protein